MRSTILTWSCDYELGSSKTMNGRMQTNEADTRDSCSDMIGWLDYLESAGARS
jgi:hypothetical protein